MSACAWTPMDAVVRVLVDAGLATDEASLVAVKRLGDLDALSREVAHAHAHEHAHGSASKGVAIRRTWHGNGAGEGRLDGRLFPKYFAF